MSSSYASKYACMSTLPSNPSNQMTTTEPRTTLNDTPPNGRPIPYGLHEITEADKAAVLEVLGSDFLTQGPAVKAFEDDFAKYVDSTEAVAVANGTAALHLCVLALGLKPEQRVITSPITFAASANCVRYVGGEPDFVDIDPETYLLDIGLVRKKLESAPRGTYAGIIPVDYAGYPVDLEAFRQLADEFGLWLLEDSCHAPGAWFTDSYGTQSRAGSGQYADLAIFSFHPVKHIASGEGGMVTTRNAALADRIRLLRTHGITRDPALLHENHGGWYHEMQELGYNYRLPDLLAALGQSQLQRAEANLAKRIAIAHRYDEALSDLPLALPKRVAAIEHAFHLYVVQTEQRKALYDYLRTKQIFTQVHYLPTHLHPYYQTRGWKSGDCPHSEAFYARCLSLPMYPSLTEAQQTYVIAHIRAFFGQ
jgi:UDP-4-amino-4,6-dideoxy-N-acetyl-beta-L-altrosamine transaminase